MVTKTYLSKSNTIIKGTDDNFGLNPISFISYGNILSRIILWFDIEKLPPRKETCIDGIRVTFKKKEIPEALRYLKKIKDLGYIISANPTGIHSYSDMELLKLLEEINYLKPDIFSIVDTLGVMNATDLLKKFYLKG